jgi:bifunctional non-homologous end joining protein LigD
VVDEPAALVWAAASGALEWHAWTSRTDRPQRPTYAVVGIEPGTGSTWQDLLTLTRLHHTALDHLGLRSLPKLTGLGGVEVWVPVTEAVGFPEVRAWAETLAATVAAAVPDLVGAGSEPGAPARLDVTGNAAGHPPVAPYSPRAAAGGPVSTPLEWDELDDASPGGCTLRDLPGRLANRGDPFRVLLAVEQSLPPLR